MSYTFLVVDKSEGEAARTVQQLAAAQRGAEVLVASSGEGALALLEARRVAPSLIFLDFSLPDMNGIELLGRIRQTRWLSQVAVAMLSQAVEDRQVVSCFRLGVCAFLTKPVQAHELRETLGDFARPSQHLSSLPGRHSAAA